MDMGPPALPVAGRTFSDISSVSRRERSGTNDSVHTLALIDASVDTAATGSGRGGVDSDAFLDASGAPVPTVRLGDPLLPLLTYTQEPARLSAGDSFSLAGLYCTPVLQYTEAVLPASEEHAAQLGASGPRGGATAGGFPGPTISLFGRAFPAQQLLAVLGDSTLVLAKALPPSGGGAPGAARAGVGSTGSHRVRHSLQARYGTAAAPPAAEAPAADAGEARAMALCVIPVHMLATRWLEACGSLLELQCMSLGRIPLMSSLGGGAAALAGGVVDVKPHAQACTLQCPSTEAALALRRRVLRASLARLSVRHGAAAALVQQPLLAAAGEVCWRGDLLQPGSLHDTQKHVDQIAEQTPASGVR